MQDKLQRVKKHFDKTENYIDDNLVISIRVNLIRENLPFLRNVMILDIGCGNGEVTLPFLKYNDITFLDISKNMLDIVRKKIPDELIGNAEIINQNFESYFPGRKYDYIFLIGVLAHVESTLDTIKKITELIKNDGSIVLQYTNSGNIVAILIRIAGYFKKLFTTQYDYKINYFSDKAIRNILNNYNLTILKEISYWPAFPGFRYVPLGIRTFFYAKILNGPLLRHLGGERILIVSSAYFK